VPHWISGTGETGKITGLSGHESVTRPDVPQLQRGTKKKLPLDQFSETPLTDMR